MSKLNRNWRILNGQSFSSKALLTLAVLLTLSPGRAYAVVNYGYLEADGGPVTVVGNGGNLAFSPSTGGGAAIYAKNGAVVTVGRGFQSTPYKSITTYGEVIATDGSSNAASSITLTAGDITMNYNPSLYQSGNDDEDMDHTLYADGGSDITLNASGTVTIEGPVGAVDSGSTIAVDGADISVTHNTVADGYDYNLEGRGIYAQNGGSVRIGSDNTDTLTIEVVNGSYSYPNDIVSSIQLRGSESSVALYGKTISITTEDGIVNGLDFNFDGGSVVIGSDATESVTVNCFTINNGDDASLKINASKYIDLDSVTSSGGSFTQIGNSDTENVHIYGTMWLHSGLNGGETEAIILGKNITFEEDPRTLFDGPVAQGGSIITVGSDETETVNIGERAEADYYSTVTVLGKDIAADYIISQYESQVVVGNDSTDTVTIDERIHSYGGYDLGVGETTASVTADQITVKGGLESDGYNAMIALDGKEIALTATDESEPYNAAAVDAYNGGSMRLGTSRTDTLYVAGGVVAHYDYNDPYPTTAITMDGKSITVGQGVKVDDEGSSITIGGAGTTQTLTSDLSASNKGVLTATISGAYTGNATVSDEGWGRNYPEETTGGTLTLTAGSATGNLTSTGTDSTLTATLSGALTGNATAEDSGTLTLTAATVTGDLATSDSGILTATVASLFTGMTTDDADMMTLNMESGSTWNLTDSSTVSTLNADGANINLLDGTLGQTLTTDTFAGSGATVYLDADGSTNTGNDHLYVAGTHTGTTALHLSSTSNTWSGALGTVLASVGDEQGSFVSDGITEAALYYYDLELASTTENVTDGYNTDWYLGEYKELATDNEGHHTTVVRNLGGITGSNYLLWRSDMDTLFRRLGETDNSLTENTDDGIWVRAKGKKFSRVSDFLVDTKYNEYEVGYDWLHDKTDRNEHVAGVGIAYLDGDSTYVTGKGDLTGYTLGLYDTTVWKDGQYLDLVLKGSRYKNEFGYRALGRHIDGKSDSTGLSLGAEYGYKRKAKSGWYVEPQAQFVLGYFRNNDFTDSNGVHVDNETIRTAIGRIGMRAGYEDKKLSAYAKANWYHDFGGNHVTTMSVDTDSLRVHEDYGDTWFAYGMGAEYKMNDKAQFYFDLERGDGSAYDENWSWDVGVKFSF